MILLDTQALVWTMEGSSKLGPKAVQAEAESQEVIVSTISLWEISLLASRGRLVLSLPIEQWADKVVQEAGISILPVTRAIAIDAGFMPGYEHGDPGDRIVIATARSIPCPVMTSDHRILAFAKAGHVRAIDARR